MVFKTEIGKNWPQCENKREILVKNSFAYRIMDPILKRKLEWEKKETKAMIQNKKIMYLRMYPSVRSCTRFFIQTNFKSNFSVRKRYQGFQRAQGVKEF